jgi:hypothetical protein
VPTSLTAVRRPDRSVGQRFDGLPYELRLFHSRDALANADEVFAGGQARFSPALRGVHRRLPMDLQEVTFPGALTSG